MEKKKKKTKNKAKTETWAFPSNKELLVGHWNAVHERDKQMKKWKNKPTKARRQKELMKITDKYAAKIISGNIEWKTVKLKFDYKLPKKRKKIKSK